MDFDDFLMWTSRSILTFWSLWGHFGVNFHMLAGVGAKLGPSWVQVGSKLGQVGPRWYQDRTKRAHKQIIHTFTAPPKGPQPANMAGRSNKEATKEQQGSNKDGPGVDPGQIFGIFSERFR